jgi:hypothetical protein
MPLSGADTTPTEQVPGAVPKTFAAALHCLLRVTNEGIERR